MRVPKLKTILPAGGALVLGAVLLLIAALLPRPLQSQRAAERWAGQGDARYVQLSRFFSPADDAVQYGDILSLREKLVNKLTAASIERAQVSTLFCDAWGCGGQLRISAGRGSFDTNVLAVGGSFFTFHPMMLRSGGFLAENDVMRDRVVLDEKLAWMLFGSTNVAGMTVEIGGAPYLVAGVVQRERDRIKTGADEGPLLYLPYDAYQQIDGTSRIEWYELILPEPAEGFGAATLEDCLPLGRGAMVQNTGRFAFGKSRRVVQHLSRLPARGEAVAFPDWENAARAAEVRCALLRAAALLLFLFPAALAVVLLVRLYLFARTRLHGKGRAVLDFVRDRAEEYRARRKRVRPGRKG